MEEEKRQEVIPGVEIRYVGMDELRIYLISDEQLRLIESGTPATTFFNLAVALLALGVGSLVSLLLGGPSPSIYNFTVVVVLIVVSFVAGLVLLILWRRFRKDTPNIIERIRARGIPPGPQVVPKPTIEGDPDR